MIPKSKLIQNDAPRVSQALYAGPDWWLFFNKFIRQGTAIASFFPSSRWLARALVQDIDFSRARYIVELGAGTGPITTEVLSRVGPNCHALIIERDPDFCDLLRRRFPLADILQMDVGNLEEVLADRGIDKVGHFLSGLPLPSFPADKRDSLMHVIGKKLVPNGTFRQLTHMPGIYYPLYRGYFQNVFFGWCLLICLRAVFTSVKGGRVVDPFQTPPGKNYRPADSGLIKDFFFY